MPRASAQELARALTEPDLSSVSTHVPETVRIAMLTGRNGRDSSIFAVESHLLIGNVSVQCHINRPAAFRNGLQGGQWLAQAPLVDPVVRQHLLGEVAGLPRAIA